MEQVSPLHAHRKVKSSACRSGWCINLIDSDWKGTGFTGQTIISMLDGGWIFWTLPLIRISYRSSVGTIMANLTVSLRAYHLAAVDVFADKTGLRGGVSDRYRPDPRRTTGLGKVDGRDVARRMEKDDRVVHQAVQGRASELGDGQSHEVLLVGGSPLMS